MMCINKGPFILTKPPVREVEMIRMDKGCINPYHCWRNDITGLGCAGGYCRSDRYFCCQLVLQAQAGK